MSPLLLSCDQWRVRKEAMMGLASIYRKYALQGEGGREASKQISWIKDKLLHIYYQNSIDDRFVYTDFSKFRKTSKGPYSFFAIKYPRVSV